VVIIDVAGETETETETETVNLTLVTKYSLCILSQQKCESHTADSRYSALSR
jgi:hypothetical protein